MTSKVQHGNILTAACSMTRSASTSSTSRQAARRSGDQTWQLPRSSPVRSCLCIPGRASIHRQLLPAPRRLPAVLMVGGEFNTPPGWIRAGEAVTTLDEFATTHGGNTPVAVFADAAGGFAIDAECVNGPRGNAADHLTGDVIPKINAISGSQQPSQWGVVGFSSAGTRGDAVAWLSFDPSTVIKRHGYYHNLSGLFAVPGRVGRAAAESLCQLSASHGIDCQLVPLRMCSTRQFHGRQVGTLISTSSVPARRRSALPLRHGTHGTVRSRSADLLSLAGRRQRVANGIATDQAAWRPCH
jgi:hypothetical protein